MTEEGPGADDRFGGGGVIVRPARGRLGFVTLKIAP